ncbi:MAG: hypothetical protein HYX42_09175 [Polaromonas sp.]|uniref:hypothetical protein n=1 Tax=Polaromonas sp. TaxID=1869339 RepID=UPI0025F5B934|nr:hypothetical protein [Polaromonas sp.]MBI2726408.1 hypothetical protein [Polaromonas sp.]
MNFPKFAVALSLSLLAASPAFACFTVYNAATNQVVYSGQNAPIDMSYQIHQKLPAAFPGGHMVFGVSNDCPAVDLRQASPQLVAVAARSAPVAIRSAPRMTRAQRERAQDALTK